jgi:hypothetical protein
MHFNIILASISCVPTPYFFSGFLIKILYAFRISSILLNSTLVDYITPVISGGEYKLWSSSLCNSRHSSVTSFLLGPNTPLGALFLNTVSQFDTQTEQQAEYVSLCVLRQQTAPSEQFGAVVATLRRASLPKEIAEFHFQPSSLVSC